MAALVAYSTTLLRKYTWRIPKQSGPRTFTSRTLGHTNESTGKVVFLRHGQSLWNKIPTFSGWCDVPLTDHGVEQAKEAGKLLRQRGFSFDIAYTSRLQRARITCETVVEALEAPNSIPMVSAWQLNERHYGKLQGRAKDDPSLIAEYGEAQITQWRREFQAKPPQIDKSHPYYEPPPAPLTGKPLELMQYILCGPVSAKSSF